MGTLTRQAILSEGAALAQRPVSDVWQSGVASSLGNGWLQRWLDAIAASWPFPMLSAEALGVPVAAGQSAVVVGNGQGTITEQVLKVLNNIWCYDVNGNVLQQVLIRDQTNTPYDRIQPVGAGGGVPYRARVFQSAFGQWTLYLYPTPQTAYKLSIPYMRIPAPLASDSAVPWYPADETMVQLIAFKTHEWFDGKDSSLTIAAQQLLSQLIQNDKVKYGMVDGVNNSLLLSPVTFMRAKAP